MQHRLPMYVPIVVLALVCACEKAKSGDVAFLDRGVAHLNKGEYDLAIRDLDQAITLKPDDASALKSRGNAYKNKGDFDRAIQDYDKAIALRPDDPRFYNDRGLAYQSKGDYDRAMKDFDQAITLKPDHVLALKNRGRTEVYLGRFPAAAADLAKGLSIDSTNPYVAIWLHFVNRRLGRDDARDFRAQLARTDSVKWPAPVARFYLGRLTADQLFKAAENADTLVQTEHRCAAAFYIGEELLARKQTAEAAKRFRETRASCPKSFTEYDGAVAELGRLGATAR